MAVKVWLRPKAVLLFRRSEVKWEQLELDKTCAINVRPNHWLLNKPCQAVSVGLPSLFDAPEPRLADVWLRETSVVDHTEVRVCHNTDQHINKYGLLTAHLQRH